MQPKHNLCLDEEEATKGEIELPPSAPQESNKVSTLQNPLLGLSIPGTIMQATGKERVICLTAERRSKRRGFKGSIHTCKPAGQGTYQASPLERSTSLLVMT